MYKGAYSHSFGCEKFLELFSSIFFVVNSVGGVQCGAFALIKDGERPVLFLGGEY